MIAVFNRRRGRRFSCGWCGRRRWTRKHMVEARPWWICRRCWYVSGG